ncbi:MAG: hypothetical protein KC613_15950, partial [Myxococcales bacterium]|nr:hypothetical protein [Myxococcales bacterium]
MLNLRQLADRSHLANAARAVVRGKRRRADVAWFIFRQEEVLRGLHDRLLGLKWRPDGFRPRFIQDPKPRVIGMTSVSDRIVHRALVDCLWPQLLPTLRPEHFAGLPGRGTHRARLRLLRLMRRFRYVVHLDIWRFFPSVDAAWVQALLQEFKPESAWSHVLQLILDDGVELYRDPMVRTHARLMPTEPPVGRGLPPGALTSQVLAGHLYLRDADRLVTRQPGVGGYVRYMDDL